MQSVKLTLADNGIIKTVIDDNINSAGESFESTTVYDFEDQSAKLKFINDLCVDIGLSFGNSKSKNQIKVIEDWGIDYKPNPKEKLEKIKLLEKELNRLSSI
jgi:hypothetical protein